MKKSGRHIKKARNSRFNLRRGGLILIMTLIFLSIEADCQGYGNEKKVGVVVSILSQKDFVEKVGADMVNITVMVPPGASPHTYEPTPSQLIEVSNAAMYAKVGSGLEFETVWLNKIIETNKDMIIVDCSEGIKLIETGGQEKIRYDPHIWLSPKNAKLMVENIYRGLLDIDPKNGQLYTKNKTEYINELDKLDKDIQNALYTLKGRKIIVYNPAWAYLARDYGLEQLSVTEGGKEPTPKVIADIIKQAKDNDIKVIIASPQFSTKSAEVIANEIHGKVILVDPLPENYVEDLYKTLNAIVDALNING